MTHLQFSHGSFFSSVSRQTHFPDVIFLWLLRNLESHTTVTQVAHLAALLSEAETQNGRLEKLVEVLKEEIRTYQRSEERHKHIENLEYVKNVILKFITLTGPGEKAALVPVLKTILRLKQEEVAQVEELVRKEGEIGTGEPESWGGYLGLWSTGP